MGFTQLFVLPEIEGRIGWGCLSIVFVDGVFSRIIFVIFVVVNASKCLVFSETVQTRSIN
jgi:hypothetical protein